MNVSVHVFLLIKVNTLHYIFEWKQLSTKKFIYISFEKTVNFQ